jgi:hypothetical protein
MKFDSGRFEKELRQYLAHVPELSQSPEVSGHEDRQVPTNKKEQHPV